MRPAGRVEEACSASTQQKKRVKSLTSQLARIGKMARQPATIDLYIILHREATSTKSLWMFAMMPNGEARGTFLSCDPSDPEQDRTPAKFRRLQLLENDDLLYKQYLVSVPFSRMHGDVGFLATVLGDDTIALSNRGYIAQALHALERANFVPPGSSDKWDNIFRSRHPLLEARRSEARPSAARPSPSERPTAPVLIRNPFLTRVNDPFPPPVGDRPCTPPSVRRGIHPRTQSATTDPNIHDHHSLSTSEDSLHNPSSTSRSNWGSLSSSSIGRSSPESGRKLPPSAGHGPAISLA